MCGCGKLYGIMVEGHKVRSGKYIDMGPRSRDSTFNVAAYGDRSTLTVWLAGWLAEIWTNG